MKKGKDRFASYITQLGTLLREASRQTDPASYLAEHNARTPLFMLEGLSKLYSNLHDKPMFSKMKDQFKVLEDLLGKKDYFTSLEKKFNDGNPAAESLVAELSASKKESTRLLNKILQEKKWLGTAPKRLRKISRKLEQVDWMKEKKEMKAILNFYQNAIVEIKVFYGSAEGHFTDMEIQVHSLRRKLRWLSIYPQALQGSIQLADSQPQDGNLNKYLVPEIINSPFNKMPESINHDHFLLLEKNYFLALSYMIDALGTIKDEGLALVAVEYHLRKNNGTPGSADDLVHIESKLQALLEKASQLCTSYFEENNLEKLVVGVCAAEAELAGNVA